MIFRRLDAGAPAELLAAQIAANSRPPETAIAETEPCDPSPGDAYIFELIGFFNTHRGAITEDTPGLPTPPHTEGLQP